MSHLHERKEKICLNCKAELIDRYCHHCGQENVEPKETVWHLIQHFFNDITHFDGKFFSSVGYLLRKPGFLSKEYMLGRRASYLNPIRMYVFSSAIFFLLLFSTREHSEFDIEGQHTEAAAETQGSTFSQLKAKRDKLAASLAKESDEDDRKDLKTSIAKLDLELAAIKRYYGDTSTRVFTKSDMGDLLLKAIKDSAIVSIGEEMQKNNSGNAPAEGKSEKPSSGDTGTYHYKGPGAVKPDSAGHAGDVHKENKGVAEQIGDKLTKVDEKMAQKRAEKRAENDHDTVWHGNNEYTVGKNAKLPEYVDDLDIFGMAVGRYNSVAAYDSAQQKLPEGERDGWFERQATRKLIVMKLQRRIDPKRWNEHFVENLFHNIPKILFISLPIFALILNILYFRQKKTYYYVSHGIFTIHVYCATFILGMALILLNKLSKLMHGGLINGLIWLVIAFILLYLMIYLYKAMRGFYGQGRAKTLVKYLITCSIAFFINTILFILFFLLSAITI